MPPHDASRDHPPKDLQARGALAETTAPTRLRFVEPTANLWLESLRIWGLTLATFGIYGFWGRVEARKQLYNSVELDGERFDYTGTGKEGLISFLIAAVIAVTAVVGALLLMKKTGTSPAQFSQFRWQRLWVSLPLLFLFGSIAYRKRHHVLRRLQLGGVPFGLTGQAWSYAWTHFWTAFLVPLTAGFAAPWRAGRLEQRKINEMAFGPVRFHAIGGMKPLYKAFVGLWIGGLVTYLATVWTLGLFTGREILAAIQGATLAPVLAPHIWPKIICIIGVGLVPFIVLTTIYRGVWLGYQVSSVGYQGGRLNLNMPLRAFVMLSLSNLALRFGSLGAFGPVADARLARFLIAHTEVVGLIRKSRAA